MRHEVIHIKNDSGADREVILEPWGMPIVVPPGGVLELSFAGPDEGATETEDMGAQVTIYAWQGSTVLARLNHEIVYDRRDLPTPPLPVGTSMRGFITGMFRGSHES